MLQAGDFRVCGCRGAHVSSKLLFPGEILQKKSFFFILTVIKVGECIEDGTEEEEMMDRRGEV